MTGSVVIFSQGATGNNVCTIANLAQPLAQAYPGKLQFNRFTNEIMIMGTVDWSPGVTKIRRCDDNEILNLTVYAQEQGYFKVSTERALEAVRFLAHRDSYDPLVDYVMGLPHWDRVERIPNFAQLYLGHDDSNRTFARVFITFFNQMIARALAPGPQCKAELVPILWGKGGLYKSTLGLALMPDPSWFSGELPEDLASKDTRMHLAGKWLVEMTEMRQFNSGRSDITKQFISTCVDRFRLPYGRLEIEFQRRCAFFASTNKIEMLHDETGNRRLIPIEIQKKILIDLIIEWRDQIWAEAYWRYMEAINNKQNWWLSDDEQADLEFIRRFHEVKGVYDEWIWEFLNEECLDGLPVRMHAFRMNDVLAYVLPDEPASVQNREAREMSRVLTRLGAVPKQIDPEGVNGRYWLTPEASGRLKLPLGHADSAASYRDLCMGGASSIKRISRRTSGNDVI